MTGITGRSMEKPLTQAMRTDGEPLGIKEYERSGGYEGLDCPNRIWVDAGVSDEDEMEQVRRPRQHSRFPSAKPSSAVHLRLAYAVWAARLRSAL